MCNKKQSLCYEVVNRLWSFSSVPERIKTLLEPDPVAFMVEVVKAYSEEKNSKVKIKPSDIGKMFVKNVISKGYSQNEYDKQLNDLKAVVGDEFKKHNRFDDLVAWYKFECYSLPIHFDPSHVVSKVIDEALKGYSLDESINRVYKILKGNNTN